MSGIDISILFCLLLPALIGVAHGFLNILFSILAWVLSFGIAAKFGASLSPLLERHVELPLFSELLVFTALFVGSLMALTALGYVVVKLLARAGLTATDRMLGFCFGFALGWALVCGAVFLAGFTTVTEENWWRESQLLAPFQHIAVWAGQFLPEEVAGHHRYGVPGAMESAVENAVEGAVESAAAGDAEAS